MASKPPPPRRPRSRPWDGGEGGGEELSRSSIPPPRRHPRAVPGDGGESGGGE
jgi:hypothetical protein